MITMQQLICRTDVSIIRQLTAATLHVANNEMINRVVIEPAHKVAWNNIVYSCNINTVCHNYCVWI